MQIINVPSNTIPWLSQEIKSSINRGDWILFASDDYGEDSYFLDIGVRIVEINSQRIVAEHDKSVFAPKISHIIFFSDIKKPESLSNAKTLAYA